ncbi:MAG: DMT family transporter [FCB group bacterium]|nr:DMT family transporter [FCB group bacterium]
MDFSHLPYFGESLSLLTAVVWAFAVILFKKSGEKVHPIGLNLFKDTFGMILFIPTLWFFGEEIFRPAPFNDYFLLLFSGVLGIGIADTLFFQCLNHLGAGLTAIIDCFYSPFIIGLSILWLGESLTVFQIIGVALIISAILTATYRKHAQDITRHNLILGITYGILSMAFMAVGIVMIKPLLDRSPLLWVTEIRLVGGITVLWLLLVFHPARRKIITSIFSRQKWVYTVSGSFVGAYLSLILWLGGMKFTQASTSAALNQTNNIFIFIFAAIFLKEKITWQRTIGIILAVSGTLLVTFGKI